MANDRGGSEILLGDVVTVAGRVVGIDGTRVVVATERGPVSVEAGETYPIDALAARETHTLSGSGSGGTTSIALKTAGGADVDAARGIPLAFPAAAARVSIAMKHGDTPASRPWTATLFRVRAGAASAVATFDFTV